MQILFFFLTLFSSYALIAIALLHFSTLAIIVKCLTSILFLTTALVSYKKNPKEPTFFKAIFIGLFFSFWGDFFLAIDRARQGLPFILGVASFSLGHIMYIIGYCIKSKFKLKDLIIFICFFIPTLLTILFVNFDFKGLRPLIIVYAVLISFMVAKSFAMLSYYKYNPFAVPALIAGSLLFFISDFLLLFLCFYPSAPSILQQCNWFLYYLGQDLLAISFSKGTLQTNHSITVNLPFD